MCSILAAFSAVAGSSLIAGVDESRKYTRNRYCSSTGLGNLGAGPNPPHWVSNASSISDDKTWILYMLTMSSRVSAKAVFELPRISACCRASTMAVESSSILSLLLFHTSSILVSMVRKPIRTVLRSSPSGPVDSTVLSAGGQYKPPKNGLPCGVQKTFMGQPPLPVKPMMYCMYVLSTSGRSSRSTLIEMKFSLRNFAISASSNDSSAMTWHQWQVLYPTLRNTGLSSRCALAKASLPQGYQWMGLWACCSR